MGGTELTINVLYSSAGLCEGAKHGDRMTCDVTVPDVSIRIPDGAVTG